MFRRFRRDREIQCPIVVLDPHTTSPPSEKAAAKASEIKANLFEHANRIYERSTRRVRRRSAGII